MVNISNLKLSFRETNINKYKAWDVSTNETSPRNFISYNNSWINLNDTRHTVKDAFLYESIRFITDLPGHYPREFDFWTYTGIILYSLNERIQ